jgi:hypothetical protein
VEKFSGEADVDQLGEARLVAARWWRLGGGGSVVAARWWRLGGGGSVVAARWSICAHEFALSPFRLSALQKFLIFKGEFVRGFGLWSL